jgi:branched-chain amino acid transport system ATP-binding protein
MSGDLSVSGLTVGYGPVGVLEGVDLVAKQGRITSLLGSNGAGKTTLLRSLSGLLRSSAGSVKFMGEEITGASPKQIVQMGLLQVPEGRGLFRNQSVRANLDLGLFGCGLSKAVERQRLESVLSMFPMLRDRLPALAGVLSGGQQQMLAIGQVLMRSPRLLMLDEPSLGLAPIMVTQVLETLQKLSAEGVTILLVEQMVERALEISDYAFVLQNGRMIGHGLPSEIAGGDALRKAYLGASVTQGHDQ